MSVVRERLRQIRGYLDLNQKEMASLLGLGSTSWQRLELEDRPPQGDVLAKLVAMGFSSDWLLTGDGEMRRDDPAVSGRLDEIYQLLDIAGQRPLTPEKMAQFDKVRAELEALSMNASAIRHQRNRADIYLAIFFRDEAAQSRVEEFKVSAPRLLTASSGGDDLPARFTLLPKYDVRASAGTGAVVHSEKLVDFVAFDTNWLRQTIGVDPKHAAVITAIGDSMYPTIADGDVLVVDLSVDRVLDNAIYALRFGDALSVKRVQLRSTGGLRIISDNTIYPPEDLGQDMVAELHVVGRIVWHGGVM
jgi:phage repressor protein C with HTH and peptisase S24 domain